jgi:predicted ArsR family transcriptional regulator
MLSPSDPAGERTRTHSALASTSRIHILSLLRDSGTPLDIAQIAARSALHPNTVRFHLRILVGAGLACCRTDPRGSSGRPRLVYTAATDGPGSHHPEGFQLLADILASYLAASPTIPPGLAEQAGHAYVRRHRRPALPTADVSADEAVRQVVAMFTELGFEPELAPQGQDIQIRLHACPFQAIARRYPEIVCSMHLGLLRGTLAELEAPVTAQGLQPFVESHLCVAHLRAAIESAPDADNPLVSSVGKDRSHGNLD